ncbi:ribonuclease P protein subunit p29-like isoform X2 [Macrobrachium nipponense]
MSQVSRSPKPGYIPLPKEVLDNLSKLTGEDIAREDYNPRSDESKSFIKGILNKVDHVPFQELFEKHYMSLKAHQRTWTHKYARKPGVKKNSTRKSSMTSQERRELGLHKINKLDKTFEMFLPINKMWKAYAKRHLSIREDSTHEGLVNFIQNNVRKLEYFGCFMRVSRSVCSEYIGVVGIVIRETKNTFLLICPDNKVKTIPKKHSEFSFVVENFGITVLGNHLNQKPAVRAKHTFKKHCIWL